MNHKLFTAIVLGILLSCGCQNRDDKNTGDMPHFTGKDMDLSFKPGNNFYLYANGGWMRNNPLPDDKARYGSFDKLAEESREKVRTIIQSAAADGGEKGSASQQIGDFFSSGMDTVAIEKDGLKPLQPYLEMINKISSKQDLINVIGKLQQIKIYPLFRFSSDADLKNSSMMIADISQNGLGMSDRDYYTEKSEHADDIRNAYKEYIGKLWLLSGSDEAVALQKADEILNLETQLALVSNSRLENRDPQKVYNKTDLAGLKKQYAAFDWDPLFTSMETGMPHEINVSQPRYMIATGKMLDNVNLDTWKDYLTFHLLREMAPYLTSDFANADFEFYGKKLSGKLKQEPRWKQIINATNDALGEAVGQLFVTKYFPPEAKTRMENLVENLRIAFGERIDQLDWMSDSTKEQAKSKLAAINVKIGYPNKWRDYKTLDIQKESYVTNILNSRKFDFEFLTSKIGKPVDKEEWHMTPQTVNAYYNPSANEIVFPAAILQPPFFYLKGDDAVNYGGIGVVIGHEMTHGFDDQGRQFDKVGNLNDWWQESDAEKFKTKSQVLVDLFDAIIVKDTIHANGQLTLGENIADLGGLHIAYQAFKNTLKTKPEPEEIDGFTADQRFFLGYARIWAQNIREEEKLRRVREDVHSLGEHRINGPLPNMQSFVDAFAINDKDSLFIPVESRAKIW